ncbi:MAG: hypothetical protein ACLRWQ_18170 [Flavonifractor plautii]
MTKIENRCGGQAWARLLSELPLPGRAAPAGSFAPQRGAARRAYRLSCRRATAGGSWYVKNYVPGGVNGGN